MKTRQFTRRDTMVAALIAAVASAMMGCGDELLSDDGDAVEVQTSALTSAQRTVAINAKFIANQSLLVSANGGITQFSNGAKQDFTGVGNNSSIYLGDAVNSAKMVIGFIRSDYLSLGAQGSVLGYPTSDEFSTEFGTGRYNFFQSGKILWKNSANAAFETHGAINGYYNQLGSEWGNLGFPQSNEKSFTAPGSAAQRKNDFENGKIYYKDGMARGVMTVFTTSNNLVTKNWPRITDALVHPRSLHAAGCLFVKGAGWKPGAGISFATNDPESQRQSTFTATVAADGTFTFDEQALAGATGKECTPNIWRINGLVTIEAKDSANGQVAIKIVGANGAGTEWLPKAM